MVTAVLTYPTTLNQFHQLLYHKMIGTHAPNLKFIFLEHVLLLEHLHRPKVTSLHINHKTKLLMVLPNGVLQGWANSNKEVENNDPFDISGSKIASDIRLIADTKIMIADDILIEFCFYRIILLTSDDSFVVETP